MAHVVVVGGGLTGTWAAVSARRAGAEVTLVGRAPGASAVSSGAIDFVPPGEAGDPTAWLSRLPAEHPRHPYLAAGGAPSLADLEALAGDLGAALAEAGLPHRAKVGDAVQLVAPTGQLRRSGMCQATIAAGDLRGVRRLAVAGIAGLAVLDGGAVAAALTAGLGVAASGLRLPPPPAAVAGAGSADDLDVAGVARAVEEPGGAEALGASLAAAMPAGCEVVLVPAVLGLADAFATAARVAASARVRVAELLAPPPSAPGWRLQAALARVATAEGVAVVADRAVAVATRGARVSGVRTATGGDVACDALVLAGGRFLGGGLSRTARPREPLLDLPVFVDGVEVADLTARDLVSRSRFRDQPILGAGLRVDALWRPVDRFGNAPAGNVVACGALLAGLDSTLGAGGLGVAAWTAAAAGRSAAGLVAAAA